jgi:YD repeat-containing protein
MTNITRPNGTFRHVVYDAAGQMREIWERKANGAPIALFKLQWDAGGRMEHEFSAPLPHAYTEPSTTATYDADNKLATWNGSGSQLNHDADGNLLFGPLTNATLSHYEYDARNRLVESRVPSSSRLYRYVYDAEGHRVRTTEFGGLTNRYAINPQAGLSQVLVRMKQDGSQTLYVYGAGLLYEVDGSGNAKYYHYDYRGSTVAITDAGGNVTDRVEYSAYGTTAYRLEGNPTARRVPPV